MILCFALLCACVAVSSAQNAQSKVVQLSQGPVRGYMDPDGGLFTYYGIPYASAPTGTKKFKAPLPPPTWTEPLDAINTNILCPQAIDLQLFPIPMNMQEDCLIANVYVPDTQSTNLPVVIYVHGGAFQFGAGNFLNPVSIARERNLIGVTFNYRLGLHGFLCLGTEDVPGNGGMKDQVALIRWVRQNIANFGGNPNDITLYGSSAGGASVDLLMLSKTVDGLYNKVIPESGANVGVFSVQVDPIETAKWYAREQNFTQADDFEALEEFYKTAPYSLLTKENFIDRKDSTFAFSPCVERDVGQEIFLDDVPVNILKKGEYTKVPILYGFANMEGLFRINYFKTWASEMNENFADFLPADLEFDSEEEKNEVAQTIKEFYFGDQPVDQATVLDYVDYFSDVIFAYPMLRSVRMQLEAGNNQIYLYEYSFVDDNTPYVIHTNVRGADHSAQTYIILDPFLNIFGVSTEEHKAMQVTMRDLWTNFIISGNPIGTNSSVSSWPPVSSNWSPHMSLGPRVELKSSLLLNRTLFWEGIYEKHYRYAIPPTTASAITIRAANTFVLSFLLYVSLNQLMYL